MAKKYVLEDNFKNILNGIQGKIPKELEVNINTNINRVKVELLDSPVTLTVNSWGAVNLNRPMTDFDEVEFEYRPKFGVNTQFRKFSVLNSSLLDMTSDGRCMDSFTMEAGVTNNVINQYVGIIMRIPSNDYQNPEFFTRFGGALSSATIELAAVRGINYTQSYGDTPIGTVISYMGITPPDEYLSCDGTTYNIQDYWELAEFIKTQFGSYNYFGGDGTTTFKVPDLRGEFLRGTGTNSHANQGSGASVGTHQDGTEHTNPYQYGTSMGLLLYGNAGGTYNTITPTGKMDSVTRAETHYSSVNVSNTPQSSPNAALFTSRPTNTSILYCIKYTNSPSMQPSNVYSTEEKRIGTWIDGKPLYQTTVQFTTPSVSGTQPYSFIPSVPWSDIDTFIGSDGVVIRSDGYTVENRFYYNSNNMFSFHFNKTSGNIFFYVDGTPTTAGQPAILTFRYTKV